MPHEAPVSKRRVYVLLAIAIHVLLAGLLVGLGIGLSVSHMGIVAGTAFVFILLLISLSYIRNFGTEPIGYVRTGSLGFGRADVLLVGMTTVGWIVLVVILTPGMPPGSFLWLFLVFWALCVIFLVVVVLAAKNIRKATVAKAR